MSDKLIYFIVEYQTMITAEYQKKRDKRRLGFSIFN